MEKRDARVALVIESIRRSCARPPSLADLSSLAGISVSRLQHLFKEEMRMSIREYVSEIRLTMAVEMVAGTKERIRQICFSVGFADVSNFNHAFKRRFGVSPREYRTRTRLAPATEKTNVSSGDQSSAERAN